MARPLGPVGELAGRVGGLVDAVRETRGAERASIRAKLTSYTSVPASPRPRFYGNLTWVLSAAAILLVLLGWSWRRHQSVLEFTVGTAEGQLQAWLAAPIGSAVPIKFSDGSDFQVRPNSRVRVVGTSADGAKIAIERGELHAEVVPRPHGAWRVIAGPFTVQVTGTVFDVRWDPSTERIDVTVTRGSVNVIGPIVGSSRAITAGFRLSAELPQSRLEVVSLPAVEQPLAVPVVEASANAATSANAESKVTLTEMDTAEPAAPRNVVVNESASEKPESNWRSFAKAGRLKEAFASAERHGFTGLCDSASASDLLLLGDAARLAGRPERATYALQSLRRRFPTDSRSAVAAFALGKVAFDQRHAYAEAAKWFSTSLQEQPSGAISREAAGRLIEAYRNAGDSVGAARAARQYLSKYPEGPHAKVAQSVLR